MAEEKSVAILGPDPGGAVTSDGADETSRAIAEKNELRKNLNAYAIMAYVAVSDRNAMAEQLKGLDHLNRAVMELQEKHERAEERAGNAQLEIWRNEAFVTRSRLQLRLKDNEIKTLKDEVRKLKSKLEPSPCQREAGKSEEIHDSGKDSEVYDSDSKEGETVNEGAAKGEDGAEKKEAGKETTESDYLMSRGLQIGVSREVHEAVVHENLHLKNTLQQALEKQGASLRDLTDTIQFREIIKQLKKTMAGKDEEIAKIENAIRLAEGPKEKTAKMLLEMEAQVKDAGRTIKMKEVMMEALSSRCEELTKALEQSEDRQEIRAAYVRSPFTDSKSTAEALAKVEVDQVLPSLEIKKLTKENARLKKLHEHQAKENEALRKELYTAQTEKNEFQRKFTSISNLALQPCATCRDYRDQNEKMKRDLSDAKGDLSAAIFQVDTYKTDFQDRLKEMDKVKQTADTWKQNYQRLNMQMEKIKRELELQMNINSELRASYQTFTQERTQRTAASIGYGPLASMPATIASGQCTGSTDQVNNPWQESSAYSRNMSEIAVGRDKCDLQQDETDSPSNHQWTAAPHPSSSRGRARKLQCMHCRQEFSPERQREYEDHQSRCPNRS